MAETRIPLETWVNLPRLGTAAFKELMKAGVEYKTGRGFFIRSSADLAAAKRIIAAAAGGEVYFSFKCFTCGKDASCADCSFRAICSVDSVGGRCLCSDCAGGDLATYRKKWADSLGGT
ncbi:MAG TPA: hypothetical protein VMS77_06660 [Conexivisphaerales archaeon]|nr:hypothetical protein [Conexivisphaerales archaeon]